jgi:hypothetical protein
MKIGMYMNKLSYLFLLLAGWLFVTSCNKTETYAEQKQRERNAINAFIVKKGINVISESDFENQNYTTDLSKNQYVLFEKSGVYMQIVEEGCGEKMASGESTTVLCRFSETNLLTDSMQLTNNNLYWNAVVDKMYVTKNGITYTASFDSSSSVMYKAYGSTSVPAGWLVPLTYINLGRPSTEEDKIAEVHLIVPHSQGQTNATSSVYPCYYEITYKRGR